MSETLGENIEIEAGVLVYGGVNDILRTSDWAPAHWTHRTGTDIDFDVVGANNLAKFDQMIRAGERGISEMHP
jgi:hypothetical protein